MILPEGSRINPRIPANCRSCLGLPRAPLWLIIKMGLNSSMFAIIADATSSVAPFHSPHTFSYLSFSVKTGGWGAVAGFYAAEEFLISRSKIDSIVVSVCSCMSYSSRSWLINSLAFSCRANCSICSVKNTSE